MTRSLMKVNLRLYILNFTQVDSIVAIPASIKSVEIINFAKIVDQSTNESEKICDDWSHVIKGGQSFLETHIFVSALKLFTVLETKLTVQVFTLLRSLFLILSSKMMLPKETKRLNFFSNAELCSC